MSKKNSITAMALGIASLVLGINGWETLGILAVAGLVCAIISFNFQKKAAEEGAENGFTKAAKITSIIGLIFSILGLVGGLICVLGQSLTDMYKAFGLEQKTASLSSSVTLIFRSALLTALGLYEKLAKHAGAGTLVPITGFANSVAAPALEFKTEGWVLGLGAKIFIISGPVILYGTLASVAYGLIYYFFLR